MTHNKPNTTDEDFGVSASENGDNVHALINALEIKIATRPKLGAAYDQLIKAYMEAEDYKSAMETAKIFMSMHPKKVMPQHFFIEIAKNVNDVEYAEWLNALVKVAPENLGIYHHRALQFAKAEKYNAAFNDIRRACEINPNREFKTPLRNAMTKAITNNSRHHSLVENLHIDYPNNASLFWLWAKILSDSGQVERFRMLIRDNWAWAKHKNPTYDALFYMQNLKGVDTGDSTLSGRKLYDAYLMANQLEAAIKVAPNELGRAFALQAQALIPTHYPAMEVSDYTKDVLIAGAERPNGIVLAFGGLADKIAVPSHILDYFFAELGLTVLYLQDFKRHIYLQGVGHYGKTLVETLSALEMELKRLGSNKPVFTFGNSGGGLAAMIYGAKLGAKASLVFSPPASVRPQDMKRMGETRSGIVARRLMKNIDHDETSLRRILTEHRGDYNVHVYVGADYKIDRAHAEMIETMPKTHVHYLEGVDTHTAFLPAVKKYGLLNLLTKHYAL